MLSVPAHPCFRKELDMKILDVDEFNKIVGKALEECREEISDSFYRGAKLMIDNVNEMAEETAVEVADRPQGEWVFKTVFPNDKSEFPMGYLVCSVCGSHYSNSTPCNYCDNCGARMKGAEDDNA